jgi:3-dehydroquinate synthase
MSVIISPIEESLTSFFAETHYTKVFVICDNHTKRHCYPIIQTHLPKHRIVVIQAGEEHKTLATCEKIWESMTDYELDRHSLVINLGGGVIGDMGGFCAATYKRGIDFIQIPTTLLAQVDASVGGKLGIDFHGFKNHIGVFNLPTRVFIDYVFLETLPERELKSGFAEVIKHCLIQDAEKWSELRLKDFPNLDWLSFIRHSVQIKQQVVEQDPTEKGLRKILNFGHTLGHAIETYFLDKGKLRLYHGEAIAIGMIMEAFMAYELKLLDETSLLQIEEFLFSVYGKIYLTEEDIPAIIQLTQQDKKNKGKEVRFSLLNSIGSCVYDRTCTPAMMKRAILYYIG